MARNKSPVDLLLTELVKQAVTAALKPLGFKKTGFNFHRRHLIEVGITLQTETGGYTFNTWNGHLSAPE